MLTQPRQVEGREIMASDFTSAMIDSFWSKVSKGPGCWLWKASLKTTRHGLPGYGMFATNKRTYTAHRVSFALKAGCCPSGQQVKHSCDNPQCVNPDHLSLGTNQDNVSDMISKRRHKNQIKTHCPKGHPLSGDNVYSMPSHPEWRYCKTCRSNRKRPLAPTCRPTATEGGV